MEDRRPQTSEATSSMNTRDTIERRCVLWTHDESFSKEEVVLNLDLFPAGSVKAGDLMAIYALKTDAAIRDFQEKSPTPKRDFDNASATLQIDASLGNLRSSIDTFSEGHYDIDSSQRYLFEVKDLSEELKLKQLHLEISVTKHISEVFGFKPRSNVVVTTADTFLNTASHVELSFKDEYLARSDMWRLAISELTNRTIYKGQKIVFLGTIKAHVTSVFVAGKKVQSAFFSTNTKPIFRSESARFVLFIQMSREMWDFDSEGSGEIMFTKVVNGFLPALFKRWAAIQARHLVSIVLFTRVEYETGIAAQLETGAPENTYYTGVQTEGARKPYKDFYRVVVSEMASGEWTTILHTLKGEFRYFRRDISLHRLNNAVGEVEKGAEDSGMGSVPGTTIEADPTLSLNGNVLEAINLASTQFSQDYIDRDLVRTGISVVVITPGPGLFEVDYETLRTTTETLISSGIGIDLVCLPKIPLHSVPLFRYRNPHFTEHQDDSRMKESSGGSTPRQVAPVFGSFSTVHGSLSPSRSYGNETGFRPGLLTPQKTPDEWSFAIPHWLDVSYWTGASQDLLSRWGQRKNHDEKKRRHLIRKPKDFAIRCKMYELEMASIENDAMVEISVAFLPNKLQYAKVPNPLLDSPTNNAASVPPSKKHATLTDPILGPIRWAGDKKISQTYKDLFEEIDSYDEKQSVPSKGTTSNKIDKQAKIKRDKVRKILASDTEVFGTSYKGETGSSKTLDLMSAELLSPKKGHPSIKDAQSPEKSMKPRKDSSSGVPKIAAMNPLRPPKIYRHISLGKHGFGIAAPKAVAAEIQIENVNAAQGSTTAQIPGSSAVDHLLSSPRNETRSERPVSSAGSLRSSKDSVKSSEAPVNGGGKSAPSRPIAIKSATQNAEVSQKSRSILGSLYEVPASDEEAEIPILQTLKSSDSLRTSKSMLFSGSGVALPKTLLPTTALSPWLNLLNPSNPTVGDNIASQYKRWQHVFPRPLEVNAMKWKSLCSPASVPLTTEFFPTRHQLSTEYHQKPHHISQYVEDEMTEEPKSRDEFLRELVSLRLSQGFQIVVGSAVAEAFGQKTLKIANAFDKEQISEDGSSIFMSLGNSIHQLSCVNGTEIEVNLFTRKVSNDSETSGDRAKQTYRPAVRTTLAADYESRAIKLSHISPKDELNWNLVDSFVAGHDEEMSENLRFWRARFVLIPIQQTTATHRPGIGDSAEETRLEGIRALTQMWQRNRYVLPGELPNLRFKKGKKDINPLDIVYQTQDPSVAVNAELETLSSTETGETQIRRGLLLSGSEPFRRSNLKIADLAEAIQAPAEKGGVRMQNRRWHFRLHYNCFIGSDMTTWLLENFEDIETREEAVEFGNMLMVMDEEKRAKEREGSKEAGKEAGKDLDKSKDLGIFVHVEKRHPFRDGQYFYQVAGEFANPRPDMRSGWTPFANRRRDTSVPSTPMSETGPRDSPRPERVWSSSGTDDKTSSGTATPTAVTGSSNLRKPRVALSKVMKYDVDPRRRSYRSERVNLHYDRLHNPDNCYHIRLDWLNVTPKLIEDAIQSWAATGERYGLRLIEVPIAEASVITLTHPFRSPYMVSLACPPPERQPATYFDAQSLGPQVSTARHVYHQAILKKFDFVLDVEAAQNFPSNVEVLYSWGRPDYKYPQYIHRSGVILAQITDDGEFLLLANKLYNNRSVAAEHKFVRPHVDRLHQQSQYNAAAASPISSPVVRPYTNANPHAFVSSPSLRPTEASADVLGAAIQNSKLVTMTTPESIKDELEQFCLDVPALKAFYQETLEKSTPPSATPPNFLRSERSGPDHSADGGFTRLGDIPTLGLPPGILARTEGGSVAGSPSPGPRFGMPSISNLKGKLTLREVPTREKEGETDSPRSLNGSGKSEPTLEGDDLDLNDV